jgi:REP-associated tyrosine transposase
MVRYRRNRVEGGTYFFTVTLADRRSSALVDHIPALRAAFRIARHERPFSIDAIVVLPEHLHVLMTLPPDRRRLFWSLAQDQGSVQSSGWSIDSNQPR